jgi:hypothetical protein
MIHTAWTAPLWTDELFSLQHYSNHGFLYPLTHYDNPNNHVLYNSLTALVPGPDFAPWRAHLLAIVAAVAAQGLILYEFGRRRLFLEGAVVYALFAVNMVWLDSILQARGYAFVALATVVIVFAAWRFLEDPRRRWLAAGAAATLFGAWAQPIFAIFCGAFWAALWVMSPTRRRAVFFGALAAGTSVLIAYLPILRPLKEAESTFGDQFGRLFTDVKAVSDVFALGLLNAQVTGITFRPYLVFFVVLAVLILVQVAPLSTVPRRYVFVFTASSVLFLSICLYLETPYFRAVAFVLVPFVVAGAAIFTSWYRHRRAEPIRPLVALVVAGVLIANGWRQASTPMLPPLDDFRSVAAFVMASLPEGTVVSTQSDPAYLPVYLSDAYPVANSQNLDEPSLRTGGGIRVDYQTSREPSADFTAVTPIYAEARVPQRLGLYQRILVPQPPRTLVSEVVVDGSRDAGTAVVDNRPLTVVDSPPNSTEPWHVTVRVDPTVPLRSLFLVTPPDAVPGEVIGSIIGSAGESRDLTPEDINRIYSGLVLDLGDQQVQEVQLTLRAPVPSRPITLAAVWAEPSRLTAG